MIEKATIGESQYTLQRDGLQCRLEAQVNYELIDAAYAKQINDIAEKYREKGFRPGRVPTARIKSRFGAGVMQEVVAEAVDESFRQVVAKEALHLAGRPQVTIGSVESKKPLDYKAQFECFPEIVLKDIKDCTIDKPEVVPDSADIDAIEAESLRAQREWKTATKASEKGMRVTIDYEGTLDGVPFSGGSAKDSKLIIGDGAMVDDFEAGLHGLTVGEERSVAVTFPSDYSQKSLAGREALFTIVCKDVAECDEPIVNEDFLKRIGSTATTRDEFREELARGEEERCAALARQVAHARGIAYIRDAYEFDVPEILCREEMELIQKRMQGREEALDDEVLKTRAVGNIRATLVIQKIAQEQKIIVTDEQIDKYLSDVAPSFVSSDMFINWYRQDKDRLSQARAATTEHAVVAWLVLQSAGTTDKITMAAARQELASDNEE